MKIFYLIACEECHHSTIVARHYGFQDYCIEHEREIPDIGEIASFCELEDALEITGIPCSHVAPEGVCERCGEEVKDRCIGKE